MKTTSGALKAALWAERKRSMRTMSWKFVSWMGALALVFVMVPSAAAQCGLATKPIKPAVWHPQYGRAHLMLARAGQDDGNQQEPSIVGMWHVILTAKTGPVPVGTHIDDAIAVWHSDGTEIMNSSRPAQDGQYCMGVWKRIGDRQYYLNHIPWHGNEVVPNDPYAIGALQAGAQLTQKVTLSPDGNSYSGTFTLKAYDSNGELEVTFTGVLNAKRITTSTSITDLF
jgi:hypothetical protein